MDSFQAGGVQHDAAMATTSHPSGLTLQAGTHARCTCGLSQNGSFCDGSDQRQND
jgi:CDGSH-type Zn-finger protein